MTNENDARQQLIAILQVGGIVVTAIAFLMWLHQAYRNLTLVGTLA